MRHSGSQRDDASGRCRILRTSPDAIDEQAPPLHRLRHWQGCWLSPFRDSASNPFLAGEIVVYRPPLFSPVENTDGDTLPSLSCHDLSSAAGGLCPLLGSADSGRLHSSPWPYGAIAGLLLTITTRRPPHSGSPRRRNSRWSADPRPAFFRRRGGPSSRRAHPTTAPFSLFLGPQSSTQR